MSVGEYATKFEELSKYCPYYWDMDERSKWLKFENGLKPHIKQVVEYLKVVQFPVLVNHCRIYENDMKARQTQWERKF